jgi:N-acetylglucosamine-6-phosphate deacetylase
MAPSAAVFERLWQAARGHVRMITLAPEIEGAAEVIAEACGKGVCVSLGHSDAGQETAQAAIRLGARHATHVFNAMRPLHHRDPGLLGEILTNDGVSADIIADGIHLDATVVRMFLQLKGPERAVLITDAMAATGMPDGQYRLGMFEVEVRDGRCTREGRLAGSVLTLDQAVRNVMKFAGWGLQKSVGLATRNAARVARVGETHGRLVAGARADLVALDAEGAVRATVIGGKAV